MSVLDGDGGLLRDSVGTNASRDIVQFVPFSKYNLVRTLCIDRGTAASDPLAGNIFKSGRHVRSTAAGQLSASTKRGMMTYVKMDLKRGMLWVSHPSGRHTALSPVRTALDLPTRWRCFFKMHEGTEHTHRHLARP